uniref:Uncharacterized protein n=1 Tax=Romanomermis culicivorax TaxID=13658 RepID=A0A915ILL2_ROMCU
MKFVKDTVQIRTSSTDDSIENIVKEYSALAHKLNAVVHVQFDIGNASLLFGCGKAAYHGPHSVENVNHINMLPSDPYKNSYLVGCSNNQNVYRISVPDLHKTVQSGDT